MTIRRIYLYITAKVKLRGRGEKGGALLRPVTLPSLYYNNIFNYITLCIHDHNTPCPERALAGNNYKPLRSNDTNV